MSRAFKFGWLPHGDLEEEFHYEDVWAREQTIGPERLVLAPSLDQVDLLLALAGQIAEPLWLLYVLAVPRGEGEPGRYQTTSSLTHSELSGFLARFRNFLEGDSRQSLWIRSESGDQLIYDRHNVIYAYGALDAFAAVALERGLHEVADVSVPSPHVHKYNQYFDSDAAALLQSRDWLYFPLLPNDDV